MSVGPIKFYRRVYGAMALPLHLAMLFYVANGISPKRNWDHSFPQNVMRAAYTLGEHAPLLPKPYEDRLGTLLVADSSCSESETARATCDSIEHIVDNMQGKSATLPDYPMGVSLPKQQRDDYLARLEDVWWPVRERGDPKNFKYAAILLLAGEIKRTYRCLKRGYGS